MSLRAEVAAAIAAAPYQKRQLAAPVRVRMRDATAPTPEALALAGRWLAPQARAARAYLAHVFDSLAVSGAIRELESPVSGATRAAVWRALEAAQADGLLELDRSYFLWGNHAKLARHGAAGPFARGLPPLRAIVPGKRTPLQWDPEVPGVVVKPPKPGHAPGRRDEALEDAMEAQVDHLNEFLGRYDLDIPGGELHNLAGRRIFAGGLDRGGRFYVAGARLPPRETRGSGTIDGQPVAELDWSAMFLRLLAWREGVDLSSDPYAALGDDREVGKASLVSALGSRKVLDGGRARVPRSIRKAYPWLVPYLGVDMGAQLQAVESAGTLYVLGRLVLAGVPVMGLHDGFLVPRGAAELCGQAMTEAEAVLEREMRRRWPCPKAPLRLVWRAK